ncbi:MAG: MASE1 domain-containing protein [Stenotrophomonas sp.]
MRLNWWNEGLQLKLRIRPAGLVLTVLYAIACWASRQVSLDQFYLPAGVRVAAVLLCPPRLWPYLLLGEYAYFAQMRLPMVDKYGLSWVVLGSALLMPAVMLIVHAHRKMMATTRNAWLISVAAVSALVVTTLNLALAHLLWPTPPEMPVLASIARLVVGDFIGILTLAPLALLWTRRTSNSRWTSGFAPPAVAAMALMAMLGLYAAWLPSDEANARTSIQLLMALPAVVLTCLYGWRGAAIGVPALNLIIGLTTIPSAHTGAFDATAFASQQIMAVTGAALLVLGSRITHYYHRSRLGEVGERDALRHARNSLVASELDLRERARHLRKLGDGIDTSLSEVVNWLNAQGHPTIANSLLHLASVHSRQFREQTSMVYPAALEHLGLYVALQAGGVRETWELSHRVMRPRLLGDPCQLSVGLQLAAYRTLTDAVSLLLNSEAGQISVRVRCGRVGPRRGILMSVALLDGYRALSAETTAAAVERLAGRALAYGGSVHPQRNRIRVVMMETGAPASLGLSSFHPTDHVAAFGQGRSQAQT